MPEGSIRAVIALSLILLFAILSIYLFNSISTREMTVLKGLTRPERDAFVAELAKEQIVGIAPVTTAGGETYDISILAPRDPATDGFAKELLILLGTLVTSIASFYFGTKAAAPVTVPGTPQATPKIDRITPNTLKADGNSVDLQATGSNLGGVKGVNATFGANEIAATIVNAGDKSLAFRLLIPTGKPPGAWDVMLVDAAGATKKAATLTVTA